VIADGGARVEWCTTAELVRCVANQNSPDATPQVLSFLPYGIAVSVFSTIRRANRKPCAGRAVGDVVTTPVLAHVRISVRPNVDLRLTRFVRCPHRNHW